MITEFVSFKTIFASLYRTLGNNFELNEGDCIEWGAEALAMIGAYGQYEEISDCITITNGKVKLPCGFDKLVDITYKNHPLYWATNTAAKNYQCSNCQIPVCGGSCDYTFYINNSYLITNIENHDDLEANLCIVYLGVPVDEEGYPLIPSDIYYNKAITSYIIMMLDAQDYRRGKISDKVYEESKFNWGFYVNSARGAANMPNKAMLENFKNIMQRIAARPNMYKTGFKNLSKPENLNL